MAQNVKQRVDELNPPKKADASVTIEMDDLVFENMKLADKGRTFVHVKPDGDNFAITITVKDALAGQNVKGLTWTDVQEYLIALLSAPKFDTFASRFDRMAGTNNRVTIILGEAGLL